ncbi:MAG: alpha/beta hydrolase [Erysipelotrichaceae bacterium]|nr:alpha/beta hydrolase [Erysipelotrichaceae bacterium]
MIVKKDVLFTPVNKVRRLHIYLPDDYEESEEHYPVMYFFDGHNLFFDEDATFGKSWGLKEFLDHWSKKIIIVGIECGHENDERLIEYCPYHYIASFCGEIDGIGHQTLSWIADELKPMIDQTYRTYTHREATGIGGSSMGGLMAVYAAAKFNDTFSKAACLSSSIAPCMTDIVRDIKEGPIDPDTRVYLSWGEHESYSKAKNPMNTVIARANLRAEKTFMDQGATTYIYYQHNGYHSEASWERQVPLFMNFLWLG